jgi:uncharacterized protein (TIGR00290 family)
MKQQHVYINWSGGKDSALCLNKILLDSFFKVNYLLTSINAVHNRVSMHGVRRELLMQQASAIGIPLRTIELPEQPGMAEYEERMKKAVDDLKSSGCTHAAFGDIFLEDLRTYRETKLNQMGVKCVFPLWKADTRELVKEFIETGFRSIVVCVNDKYLDTSFCGRLIDEDFVNELPHGVDPCGENGEFHSFVFEAPFFKDAIRFKKGEVVYRKYKAPASGDNCHTNSDPAQAGFYFCDLLPSN